MTDLTQVTYCGLYCGLCAERNRIPLRAQALRDAMHKEGWDLWGREIPNFKEFWAFLNGVAEPETLCNCREGQGGPPFCGIRKCARERGADICPFCSDYPCERIQALAKGYVMMLADGQRMREIGLDAWIEEQEARKKTGFAYVDIRCEPYDVPD
ncbi:MAG: DUF3795 domain-containing protein [Anaerolineales bacterium]|nr:DUF3795 domain-containing protein [Anaerolineales bacterium]